MKRIAAMMAVLTGLMVSLTSADAQQRVDFAFKKADVAKFKVIMAKIDPEIKTAQKALQTAKGKLNAALNDDVFNEKGAVEGKVIDELKLALKYTDLAMKHANKAQKIDKGGD